MKKRKIQQKQWNIQKKIHAMEGFQIYNLEPCHARVSKIFYLVRFHIFEPYQRSKNKIKQLKNNEQQWQIMKNSIKKPMKKYEKYNKNNETYRKKNPRNGRLPNR